MGWLIVCYDKFNWLVNDNGRRIAMMKLIREEEDFTLMMKLAFMRQRMHGPGVSKVRRN